MSQAVEIETNDVGTTDKSFWDKISAWSEWASDYGNAILVKETRQAFKSRQFVITFMLVLIVCWVISFFGITLGGNQIQYGETATMFFLAYFDVLTVAVLIFVPFTAFRSLLQERDLMTYDLLSITALKPRQIIVGKLSSALLQTLIYFSAIAPFIAFTAFLGGFDFAITVFMLSLAFVLSMFYCTITIMIAAFAKQRIYQALLTIPVLLGLIFQEFFIIFGLPETLFQGGFISFSNDGFWWIVGFGLITFITYTILFLQIATTQLTFASGNRSTAIRITCMVQFVLFWASFIAIFSYARATYGLATIDEEAIIVITVITGIHLAIVGLFTTSESNFLSRRIRRDLPKSSLVRFLSIPFMPGSSRGFLYIASQIIVMGIITISLWLSFGSSRSGSPLWGDRVSQYILLLCSYLIIFLGFTTAMSRWGEKISGDLRPGHIRALALVALAGCSIFPLFVEFFYQFVLNERYHAFSFIDGISPFYTIASAIDGYRASEAIDLLCVFIPIMAALVIIINLRAVFIGINEIVYSNFKSSSRNKTV